MSDVNLGNLSFDVKLKDLTDADIQKIQKKVEKLGGNIPVDLKVNKTQLVQSVKEALKNENITINVKAKIDTETIRKLTEALNKGVNLNPGAIRDYNNEVKNLTQQMDLLKQSMQGVVANSQGVGQVANQMDRTAQSTDFASKSMERLKNIFVGLGAAFTVEEILRNVVQIGGELQKQQLAMSSILKDAGLAAEQFSRIQGLAVKSPFGIMELAQYSKQLSAFSVPYHDLYDTLSRIADISAGVGVDMGRIILAYGQVKNASVLKGTELRQFTEANIPMLDKLSERFTELRGELVTTRDVMDMISRKEVSFGDVKAVLEDLTNEGGMFYNMQEKLAESLSAKWKNLGDAIANAYGAMADSFIGDGLKATAEVITFLVQDWERLGRVITTVGISFVLFDRNNLKLARNLGITRIALTRWSAGFATLKTNITKAATAVKAFIRNIGPMIVISAVIEGIAWAWGKLTESSKRNEEAIANLRENYQSLNDQLKKFEGMDVFELQEQQLHGVAEELQEILLNYLPNAGQVLNRIFSNDTIVTFTERVEALKQEVLALRDAQADILNSGQSVGLMANEKGGALFENKLTVDINQAGNSYRELISALTEIVNDFPVKAEQIFKDFDGSTLAAKMLDFINKNGIDQFMSILRNNDMFTKDMFGRDIQYMIDNNEFFKYDQALKELYKEFETWSKVISKYYYGVERIADLRTALQMGEELTYEQKVLRNSLADDINKILQSEDIKNLPTYIKDIIQRMFAEKFDIDLRIQVKDIELPLTKLQEEINKATNEQFTEIIKKSNSVLDIYKAIKREWERATEEFKIYESLLDKAGVLNDIKAGKEYTGTDEAIKQAVEGYKREQKIIDAARAGQKQFGYELEENKSTKDSVYEMWKNRYDLIKKALEIYEKWKDIEGKDKAENRVKDNPLFADLFDGSFGFSVDLANPNDARKQIQSKLGNLEKQLELKIAIGVDIDKEQLNIAKKSVDEKLKEMQTYISQKKKEMDLYSQLFELTGDREFANRAFEIPLIGNEFTDELYRTLSDSIARLGTDFKIPDFHMDAEDAKLIFGEDMKDIYEIWLALKNALETNGINLTITTAEAMREFMPLEDRIKALEAERDAMIANYEEGSKERLAIEKKYNKLILKEQEKTYNNTDIWKKLYGGIENAGFFKGRNMLKDVANTIWGAEGNEEDGYKITYKDAEGTLKTLIVDAKTYKDLLEQINGLQNSLGRVKDESGNGDNEGKKGPAASFLEQGFNFGTIGGDISAVAGALSKVSESFSNMFESLGDAKTADALGMAGAVFKAVGDLTSGNPTQMLAAIPNLIASIAQFHDKKLNRAIEASERKVKALQNAYEDLGRVIERQLGGYATGQAEEQLNNLKAQSDEIDKQIQLEKDKKKTDHSKILDLEGTRAELQDQIKYFYEDLASEQYSANIKDWSKSISDAIVQAFAEGTDAATAFDDAVSDIMQDVVSQMLNLQVIQPAMENLREKLFGKGGIFTEDSEGGTHLTENESVILADSLKELRGSIEQGKEIWDNINEQTDGVLKTTKGASSLSANIQNITESTADLLGSYLNAIRADVSLNRADIQKIAIEMPKISMTTVAQLRQLEQITMNTQTIKEHTGAIMNMLQQATMVQSKGFYMR